MNEIDWIEKAVDDGWHNSATDLARWRGRLWLTHRRADGHRNVPYGDVVVLSSTDGRAWKEVAVVDSGLDDRDPKLLPDEDRLWLFFGGARLELDEAGRAVEGGARWIESQASWTKDGVRFVEPQRTSEAGWWHWRPVRAEDGFLAAAYGRDLEREPPEVEVALVRSDDGLRWERCSTLLGGSRGTETSVVRLADGRLFAVARGTGDDTWLLDADGPAGPWRERRLEQWMHAPALLPMHGRLLVAGRDRDERTQYATRLWWLDVDAGTTELALSLPSGGDTSYCGLVRDGDDAVLVSWYSQHELLDREDYVMGERPSAIYVARARLDAP